MTTTTNKSGTWFGGLVKRTLVDSGYVLATFPLALISFIVLITGLSLAIGLAIIWIGVPIGVATLYAAHGFAFTERGRLLAQGTVIKPLALPPRPGPAWRKMVSALRVGQLWRETLHGIVALPVSILTWTLTLTWWALFLGGLTGWIWEPFSGSGSGATALMQLIHWPISGELFDFLCGVFAFVTLPLMTRFCAITQSGLGKALLGPSKIALAERVERLEYARQQQTQAETDSLRRLERDLHDGPQQTLIRLGMDLAASQRRLEEGDVEASAELLAGARDMTESVIADLRALSRSIAPPILAERGIGAALLAVAAKSPIPVAVRYELEDEPPEAQATAAYFIACEALSNAAKHSGATQIDVRLWLDDDALMLSVSDNGTGGAVALPGHGIAGLQDRAASLDGELTISGPPGTTVTARLPINRK